MATSPEFNPIHQCFGKRTYATKAGAKKAALHVQATNRGGPLRHYRCPHCSRFHIGHIWRAKADE